MPAFEVQVLEKVANKVDANTLQKLSAEQVHALKPFEFRPRRDLSCIAEAPTVTDAKDVVKRLVFAKVRMLQPASRVLSCSIIDGETTRIKIIIEKASGRRR